MNENDLMWGSESFINRFLKFISSVSDIEGVKNYQVLNKFIPMANNLQSYSDQYRGQIEEILEKIDSAPKNIQKPLAKFFLGEFQDHAKMLKLTTIKLSKVKSRLLKLLIDTGKSNS